MSYRKPGRLYRKLAEVPKPLFRVESDTFTVTDDRIKSLSINHGGSIDSGLSPSTAEFEVIGPTWVRSGDDVRIELTDAAATGIALLTDVPAARYAPRYTGRIGRQTNTDTPKGITATFAAASWSAQLSRIEHSTWEVADNPVNATIRRLVTPPVLAGEISYASYGAFDVLAEDQGSVTDLDPYTSEIGVLLRDTREGTLEAWALPYWRDWSLDRIASEVPLTRSEALTPAIWEQPNESIPKRQRAQYIDAAGNLQSVSRGGTLDSETEHHDWTHIRFITDSWALHFDALVARGYDRLFRLPSIDVDLLFLLTSPRAYHRRQAGQLLSLNRGDTINLSGDWHPYIRGVHVVVGIDEKITGNDWTMRLNLTPWRTVFGGDSSPEVPALLWDQATGPWDDATGTWNERA